jgi:alpha-mannosidase
LLVATFVVFLASSGSPSGASQKGIAQPPSQGYTVYVVPHSHIDLEWFWTYEDTRVMAIKILRQALAMLKSDAEFAFTQDQMLALKPFWDDLSDADRNFMRRMAKEGRFEVAGGEYVQPDVDEPDFESLTRQALLAKPWMEKTFQTVVTTGWNIDTFGQTIQMPQLFGRAGLRYFVFMRGVPKPLEDSLLSPFYWESPDGTKQASYWLSGSYTPNQDNLPNDLEEFVRRNLKGNDKVMLPWGGDHYLPTESTAEIKRKILAAAAEKQIPIKGIVFCTPRRFFEDVIKSGISLPTYTYDFNPDVGLNGLYGQHPEEKIGERLAEEMLESCEKFSTVAALFGSPYPRQELAWAWEKVLFNQNHDIMGGSHSDAVHVEAMSRYRGAMEAARSALTDRLYYLSRMIDTSRGGEFPFIVFNSLSYPRTEVVRHTVVLHGLLNNLRIVDQEGITVPFRYEAVSRWSRDGTPTMAVFEFVASRVPGLGYRLYRIEGIPGKAETPEWHPAENEVSNRFFRLRLDPVTGAISSLVDCRSGQELLDVAHYQGNELVLVEERDPNMEGPVDFTGKEIRSSLSRPESIVQIDDELGIRLKIEAPFLGGRRIQEITLFKELPRIDFKTELQCFPGHNGMLTAVFPFRKDAGLKLVHETHNAATVRPDGDYDAQTWVDVEAPGRAAAILNRGTGGHIVEGATVKLILLRSVPNFQGYYSRSASAAGSQTFEYSVYPHEGAWSSDGVMEQGHSFNTPLKTLVTDAHPGILPAEHGFLSVEDGDFEVLALKKAEDGDDLIVRGCETRGTRGSVRLHFEFPIQQAWFADLLEHPLRPIQIGHDTIEFEADPFAILTFRLRLKPGLLRDRALAAKGKAGR